jgi:uncharacterized protein YuzE
MQVQYDPEADAIYVRLRESEGSIRTERVDERRMVDYNAGGDVVGVELLSVSRGVDLTGLPEASRIADAMRSFPHPAPA